jgi:hypothetical protein
MLWRGSCWAFGGSISESGKVQHRIFPSSQALRGLGEAVEGRELSLRRHFCKSVHLRFLLKREGRGCAGRGQIPSAQGRGPRAKRVQGCRI